MFEQRLSKMQTADRLQELDEVRAERDSVFASLREQAAHPDKRAALEQHLLLLSVREHELGSEVAEFHSMISEHRRLRWAVDAASRSLRTALEQLVDLWARLDAIGALRPKIDGTLRVAVEDFLEQRFRYDDDDRGEDDDEE
ncbi:hypothetical protein CG736_28185 [Kitasatospora sp. CB02891]|nr:hypothetical protein CG736_28185 [Kitasatospora sp. CB02891]